MFTEVDNAIADMGVRAMSGRIQPILDAIRAEYAGQPADTTKSTIEPRWAGNIEASISDPDLMNVVQTTSDGNRVVMLTAASPLVDRNTHNEQGDKSP